MVIAADRDLVVVDKPAGLLSVPGRGPENADCVVSRLAAAYPRLYAAHRLDMATSGVLVLALRRAGERDLHRQFRERTVEKYYVARVSGHPAADEGVVSAPLRVVEGTGRSRVDTDGKPSTTAWHVVSRDDDDTALLSLCPRTGRSHQIRVHLAHLGHPVLGDRFYAPPGVAALAPRLLLHAASITLDHPYTRQRVTFTAPVPFV